MGDLRPCVVIGTRPELIKLAPLVLALSKRAERLHPRVVFTGQHGDILSVTAEYFGISPDLIFDLGPKTSDLATSVLSLSQKLHEVFQKYAPPLVIAQGDTTTVFASALAAFHTQRPFAHVEAGLRSKDLMNPFPEEGYRRMVSVLADLHFAPTSGAKENLLLEGIDAAKIQVCGNTAIDALHYAVEREKVSASIEGADVLLTLHRREIWGKGLQDLCQAIAKLAHAYPKRRFLFTWHPNPQVHLTVQKELRNISNVLLSKPLSYPEFVKAMAAAHVVVSDSGSIQEEAPCLGAMVLVVRDNTERPEGLEAGLSQLLGTKPKALFDACAQALDAPRRRPRGVFEASPYGDGRSALKMAKIIDDYIHGPRSSECPLLIPNTSGLMA